MIGLPGVTKLRRDKGKDHRPFDLGAGLGFDHTHAGRIHLNETSIGCYDFNALRTGLENSLEQLPIIFETASPNLVSTLIGIGNSL